MNLGRVLSHTAGALAEDMEENRKYVRSAKDRMQADLYQQGLERRNKVKQARRDLESAVDFLSNEGMENEKMVALLAENPKEFLNLYKMAQTAKMEGRLSSDILNNAVKLAQGYEAADMTPSELIKRATPDFVQGSDLEIPEDKRTGLAKLFRRPDMGVIMGEVFAEDAMPGVKGGDVFASMQADVVQGKKGERGASTDYKGFNPMDDRNILFFQKQMWSEYEEAMKLKIASMQEEISRVDPDTGDRIYSDQEAQTMQGEIDRLSEYTSIDSPTALEEAMEAIGYDIAKRYNADYPEIFKPTFVSPDIYNENILEQSSSEDGEGGGNEPEPETGNDPETGTGNGTGDEPRTVNYSVIELEEGQDPKTAAQDWFRNNPPGTGDPSRRFVQIDTPDGPKYYKYVDKRGRGTGAMIVVEEIEE